MTETTIREIVRRAVSDAAFRGQLRSDPAKALAGIDVGADERAALASGDPARLTALGVDQRMSKAFSAGVVAEASRTVIGDPDLGSAGTLTDDDAAGSTKAIVGDPAGATTGSTVDAAFGRHLWTIEQDLDTGATTAAASVDAAGSPTHLQMVEQDLDTGAAATALDAPSGTTHLQMVESSLDIGPAVETPDVQITGDNTITEY